MRRYMLRTAEYDLRVNNCLTLRRIQSTVMEASACSVTSSGEVRRSCEVHHCSSLQQFCCAKILSPSLSVNRVFVVFCARVMALVTDRRIDSVEQRRRGSNA